VIGDSICVVRAQRQQSCAEAARWSGPWL